MNIHNGIIETIGKTPLVLLSRLSQNLPGRVAVKLESLNPGGSVKDRIGAVMIEDAEQRGILKANSVIVEPTSGNTGISLALAAAVKGYRLILTMPESMSVERRKLLRIFGAEIVLTPAEMGMPGAIERAEEIFATTPNAWMPHQYRNPANAEAHRKTTAVELWADTEGTLDAVVCGIGTGGTLMGCAQELKRRKPSVLAIAVEPAKSPVLTGGRRGPHRIQGIGSGFIPDIVRRDLIDEVIHVREDDAAEVARRLAAEEGILGGISSGANVWAALQVAARPEMKDKLIATFICDSGERYLSTWLFQDLQML